MSSKDMLISPQKTINLISQLYQIQGMNKSDADFHSSSLVEASLRGVDSHGVMRTGSYYRRMENGAINVQPQMKIIGENAALCVMDADKASGYIAGRAGMDKAINLANKYSIGMTSIINSNHFGPAFLYSQMAVDAGMIGITATNVKPLITVPGVAGNVVGNNPLAIGIPTENDFPFMLDMALSVVAGGKLKMSIERGEPIPVDWAVDKNGNPTTDPQIGFDGYLLAIGGYKGLGLAYAIDLICGLLMGGAFQNQIGNMFKEPGKSSKTCHAFMAIKARILNSDEIRKRMLEYRNYIRSIPTLTGDSLSFPGELENQNKKERQKHGIPVPESVYYELQTLASENNLDFDLEI